MVAAAAAAALEATMSYEAEQGVRLGREDGWCLPIKHCEAESWIRRESKNLLNRIEVKQWMRRRIHHGNHTFDVCVHGSTAHHSGNFRKVVLNIIMSSYHSLAISTQRATTTVAGWSSSSASWGASTATELYTCGWDCFAAMRTIYRI